MGLDNEVLYDMLERKNLTISAIFATSGISNVNESFSDFYAGSWQSSDNPLMLMLIRFLLALIADVIFIWCLIEWHAHWLLFLTNWGVVFLAVMHTSAAYVSYMAFTGRFTESNSTVLPWYVALYWVMYNITIPLTFLITFLYFLLLYDPDNHDSLEMMWLDVATHGLTSILAFIELFFSRTPVYLEHIVQPVAAGWAYVIITAIYFLCGGTDRMGNRYIYDVLQWWDRPGLSLAVVVLSTIAMILIYLIVCCIAIARDFISYALFRA